MQYKASEREDTREDFDGSAIYGIEDSAGRFYTTTEVADLLNAASLELDQGECSISGFSLIHEANKLTIGDAMRRRDVRRWVSVNDRLPGLGLRVLVLLGASGSVIQSHSEVVASLPGVSHWMSMPELPK